MLNNLPTDHHGFDLVAMSVELDYLFGFESQWELGESGSHGSFERDGRIVIHVEDLDNLAKAVDCQGPDMGHVFRYVLAHLKAHHDQELHRTYDKSFEDDPRPYEIDAELIAGWVCAHAKIPNSFRFHGLPTNFNDLARRELSQGETGPEYPNLDERELAFLKGGRLWAAGQVSSYNGPAQRLGIEDETFEEFLADLPILVNAMWSRTLRKR